MLRTVNSKRSKVCISIAVPANMRFVDSNLKKAFWS